MHIFQRQRPAIAMIELIFALVIMGIVMMSAPNLISQASNSSYVALQQESVSIVASHLNALLTYAWDEQNTQSQVNYTNTILKVSNSADTELNSISRVIPGVRKFNVSDINATATATLGRDNNLTSNESDDDIDDFIDVNQTLTLATGVAGNIDAGDYVDQDVLLKTDVNYMDDETNYGAATGVIVFNAPKGFKNYTTNIKYVTATLTSLSQSDILNTKKITLHAFMCNIGGAQPQSSQDMTTGQLQNALLGLF